MSNSINAPLGELNEVISNLSMEEVTSLVEGLSFLITRCEDRVKQLRATADDFSAFLNDGDISHIFDPRDDLAEFKKKYKAYTFVTCFRYNSDSRFLQATKLTTGNRSMYHGVLSEGQDEPLMGQTYVCVDTPVKGSMPLITRLYPVRPEVAEDRSKQLAALYRK